MASKNRKKRPTDMRWSLVLKVIFKSLSKMARWPGEKKRLYSRSSALPIGLDGISIRDEIGKNALCSIVVIALNEQN